MVEGLPHRCIIARRKMTPCTKSKAIRAAFTHHHLLPPFCPNSKHPKYIPGSNLHSPSLLPKPSAPLATSSPSNQETPHPSRPAGQPLHPAPVSPSTFQVPLQQPPLSAPPGQLVAGLESLALARWEVHAEQPGELSNVTRCGRQYFSLYVRAWYDLLRRRKRWPRGQSGGRICGVGAQWARVRQRGIRPRHNSWSARSLLRAGPECPVVGRELPFCKAWGWICRCWWCLAAPRLALLSPGAKFTAARSHLLRRSCDDMAINGFTLCLFTCLPAKHLNHLDGIWQFMLDFILNHFDNSLPLKQPPQWKNSRQCELLLLRCICMGHSFYSATGSKMTKLDRSLALSGPAEWSPLCIAADRDPTLRQALDYTVWYTAREYCTLSTSQVVWPLSHSKPATFLHRQRNRQACEIIFDATLESELPRTLACWSLANSADLVERFLLMICY